MKQLFGVLLLVGLAVLYWQWILAVVVVVLIVRAFPPAWREHQAQLALRRQRALEIAARADVQHAQVMAGDMRGVWGLYLPAVGCCEGGPQWGHDWDCPTLDVRNHGHAA